jgi:hypothetical protein
VRVFGAAAPTVMCAASKIAVSRWVRRHAVLPEWAGSGVRRQARAVRSFPVRIGGFGEASHLADWMCFMLSDSADFLCSSMVFVDGGSDAYFRADDWPKAVPASAVRLSTPVQAVMLTKLSGPSGLLWRAEP